MRRRGHGRLRCAILACVTLGAFGAALAQSGDVLVPGGHYTPFERVKPLGGGSPTAVSLAVPAFRLDAVPVTNGAFLAFLSNHPEWRRSQVKSLFAERRYLVRWADDLALADPEARDEPVTGVSWFAARAYCRALGKRLPTTQEWEYALADSGRAQDAVRRASLDWFARPNDLRPGPVGQKPANGFGLSDMVGLVWEWTLDFDSFAITAEARDPNGKDSAQFCGGAGAGVTDATDYPAFMRYSMRASLKANYVADILGFRCAGDP
jgi:sulfatase modifying factor 1